MKRLLLSLLLLVVANSLTAQNQAVGTRPRAQETLQQVLGIQRLAFETGLVNISSSWQEWCLDEFGDPAAQGLYAGLTCDVKLSGNLSFSPSLQWRRASRVIKDIQQEDWHVAYTKTYFRAHLLSVPMVVKYNIPLLQSLDLFAFAGPRINIGMFSNDKEVSHYDWIKLSEITTNHYAADLEWSRFHLALNAGFGMDFFDAIRLSLACDKNLLKLRGAEEITLMNNTFYFGVAYLF